MPVKVSEADIVRTCNDFLRMDGWRPVKMEPLARREWGKGSGEKGMTDYLYLRYPKQRGINVQAMWIEWKSSTGRAKPHQKDWQRDERARGAVVLCAGIDFPKTIEGFIAWYRSALGFRVAQT